MQRKRSRKGPRSRQGGPRRPKRRESGRDSSPKMCGAKTRSGGTCQNFMMRGGKRCRLHGGSSPQARRAAARRVATQKAVEVLGRLGVPIEVDPLEALLGQVKEAAGNVVVLQGLVGQLHATVSGYESDVAGIAGPNHLGDGAPHVLVVMYDKERDRLAQMAKLCLDAGVAERQIRIAERQGELLAEVINGILGDLRLTKKQQEQAPAIVRRRLTAVSDAADSVGA